MPGLLEKLSVTPRNYAVLSLVERELSAVGSATKIVGFRNNKIYVEVESSVHLNEYTFRKREILKALRSAIPVHQELPELKFFIKGSARQTRQDMLKILPDKN